MKPSPTRRGFTLIELLVSMAVGMIVLVAAVSMLGSTGEGYERASGGIGAEREARAVLTQIRSDVATASYVHPDSRFEASTATWPIDEIGFLSLQPTDAQSADGALGDLCAVHYYIRDLEIGGRPVRCLMRGFRESRETFAALRAGNVASLFQPGPRDEPVAFGVISFQARPLERDGAGNWSEWRPAGDGGGDDDDEIEFTDPDSPGSILGPDALDLRLVVARRELVGKFTTSAQWDGGGNTASLVGPPADAETNPQLEVFSIRIPFGHDDLR